MTTSKVRGLDFVALGLKSRFWSRSSISINPRVHGSMRTRSQDLQQGIGAGG